MIYYIIAGLYLVYSLKVFVKSEGGVWRCTSAAFSENMGLKVDDVTVIIALKALKYFTIKSALKIYPFEGHILPGYLRLFVTTGFFFH